MEQGKAKIDDQYQPLFDLDRQGFQIPPIPSHSHEDSHTIDGTIPSQKLKSFEIAQEIVSLPQVSKGPPSSHLEKANTFPVQNMQMTTDESKPTGRQHRLNHGEALMKISEGPESEVSRPAVALNTQQVGKNQSMPLPLTPTHSERIFGKHSRGSEDEPCQKSKVMKLSMPSPFTCVPQDSNMSEVSASQLFPSSRPPAKIKGANNDLLQNKHSLPPKVMPNSSVWGWSGSDKEKATKPQTEENTVKPNLMKLPHHQTESAKLKRQLGREFGSNKVDTGAFEETQNVSKAQIASVGKKLSNSLPSFGLNLSRKTPKRVNLESPSLTSKSPNSLSPPILPITNLQPTESFKNIRETKPQEPLVSISSQPSSFDPASKEACSTFEVPKLKDGQPSFSFPQLSSANTHSKENSTSDPPSFSSMLKTSRRDTKKDPGPDTNKSIITSQLKSLPSDVRLGSSILSGDEQCQGNMTAAQNQPFQSTSQITSGSTKTIPSQSQGQRSILTQSRNLQSKTPQEKPPPEHLASLPYHQNINQPFEDLQQPQAVAKPAIEEQSFKGKSCFSIAYFTEPKFPFPDHL